jgi:hypothetical protein
MTVKGILWRFAIAYIGSVMLAGYIVTALAFKSGSGLNIGLLAACTLWVCTRYGKANRRYFTPAEKARVVGGLLCIDLTLQLLVVLAAAAGKASPSNSGALLFALVFVGLLHAVAIYAFVGVAGKTLVKQGIIEG